MHNRFDQFRAGSLGQQLEQLIDTPQRYIEYCALSRVGLPAISAIVDELQQKFPDIEDDQSARQFCGAMVAEIMRRHQHQLLRARGRVPGGYFSYGAVWSAQPQQRSMADLLDVLATMPQTVQQRLAALDHDARRQRPPGIGFSALEHLCHLRDLDREAFLPRINAILEQQRPLLYGVNGSEWARERDYQQQDFAAAGQDYSAARAQLLQRLQHCDDTALARIGIWEGQRRLTLAELVADIADHDATHLQEIDELLLALSGIHA